MSEQIKALDDLLVEAVLGRMLGTARLLHQRGLSRDQINAALKPMLVEEEERRKAIRRWAVEGLAEPRF
ncbi:hypothetical protein [Haematobacter genomosp. 1]|uniref:Uncharacterized protein n=1 Tax=Haematobacter genomosp. 1 TaxID=366618 RepID=A0A212A728_9RHOB|nr:hypothetical protein [Haematobacter genomosp. 1]OWJ74612.1 hypothetical protein CDV49_19035 [Haematobacter genomosp. 1]